MARCSRVTQTQLLVILLRFLRETENKPPVSSDVSVGGKHSLHCLHMKVQYLPRGRGEVHIRNIRGVNPAEGRHFGQKWKWPSLIFFNLKHLLGFVRNWKFQNIRSPWPLVIGSRPSIFFKWQFFSFWRFSRTKTLNWWQYKTLSIIYCIVNQSLYISC